MRFSRSSRKLWLLLFAAPVAAAPSLMFTQAPKGEVLQSEQIRLDVEALPGTELQKPCSLFFSAAPQGPVVSGHDGRISNFTSEADGNKLTLRFRPSDAANTPSAHPQLGLGFRYLVAVCGDTPQHTPELPLLITTSKSPTIASPQSKEKSSYPQISWSAVPGVPAYHVLLSDQPIEINPENGDVSGASLIWQAITTGTSIAYGIPDPSGTFGNATAPPLSPGVTYSLVVLNNFDGKSSLASSTRAQSLKIFSLDSESGFSKPKNLAPVSGRSLAYPADSLITLRWTKSTSTVGALANTYRVFLYASSARDGVEVLVPVWDTEVTDTSVTVNAGKMLLENRYVFKVFAMDNQGKARVGDTTSFRYSTPSARLAVTAREIFGGDTVSLGDVRVELTAVEGSLDPLPLFTIANSVVEKTLPLGTYQAVFSKDGFSSQTLTATLSQGAQVRLDPFMPRASALVRGRVVDAGGIPLALSSVRATAFNGTELAAATDAQGYYLLGLSAGSYTLSFAKPGYADAVDTTVNLQSGGSVLLPDRRLTKWNSVLSGTVVNEKDAALAGSHITVFREDGSTAGTMASDGGGAFSLPLPPGVYRVRASRTGFTSAEQTLRLADVATLRFKLGSGASIVKGLVKQSSQRTPDQISVTALPKARIELVHLKTGGTLVTESDAQGQYSFSTAETGAFNLKASLPGNTVAASPVSVTISVPAAKSTVTRDVNLRRLARVAGRVEMDGGLPANLGNLRITLAGVGGSDFFASVAPFRSDSILTFTFSDVPDGTYRLSGGSETFGPKEEGEVSVIGNLWRMDETVELIAADKSVTVKLRQDGKEIAGRVQMRAPWETLFTAGDAFSPAPGGSYSLTALPEDKSVLPRQNFSFHLASSVADTTFILDLPFSHLAVESLPLVQDSLVLEFTALAPFDSALVHYGYGNVRNTARFSRPTAFPGNPRVTLRPGEQGGALVYAIVVFVGEARYSNDMTGRRFHAQVRAGKKLRRIALDIRDTLRVPLDARLSLRLRAFNPAGESLDDEVQKYGKVVWALNPASALKLDTKIGHAPVLLSPRVFPTRPDPKASALEAPPLSLSKSAATSALGPGWDSLFITVTLDGNTVKDTLPVKLENKTVHKLVLSSSLGSAPIMPSPGLFTVFVSAFDTSTTPPTLLSASPTFSLQPKEAGNVSPGGQVELRRNFIGPVRISAVHQTGSGRQVQAELGEATPGQSTLVFPPGVVVGQILLPGDSARIWFHDPSVEIVVQDSLVFGSQPLQLFLLKRTLPKSFLSLPDFQVNGSVFELSNPLGATLQSPLILRMGLAPSGRKQTSMARFETARLSWHSLESTEISSEENSFGRPSISAHAFALDGNYYALMSASKTLSIGAVNIIPNPFSPLVLASRDGNTEYGTRIRFEPESLTSEVTVSVRIFNMRGEIVRLLVDHQTVPKAPTEFYWDGKTSDGRWARNGRYLVEIQLRETGGRKDISTVKPVVLFR